MKNRINKTHLLALCAGVLLAACTKDTTVGLSNYSSTQIIPQAQLPALGIEQEPGFKSSRAQTRAAADPTQSMTLSFVRADETGNGTNTFGAYGTTTLSATRAAGSGSQALTFATPQYYLVNNARSRFTGWWPAATSFSGGVASWTLDGSQDILTAAVQEGNLQTPLSALAFEHRFSKLSFEVVASNTTVVSTWGTISGVNVLAQPTTCTYTPATNASTGAVATSGSTTYAVKNFASGALTTTAAARGDAVFVASSASSMALSLQVVSSTKGTVAVTVPARSYEAGKAYKLTLSFSETTVAVTVVPWNNVSTDDSLGGEPLCLDQNGILTCKDKMLFFQFGSVVGFTQEGDWGEDKVLFNPVTGSPTYANYTTIPVYTAADWDANRKDISDPAYHTGANIKAGKGDPCKLVGLSAKKIQSMSAAELDAYNSGWRLPTPDEQCDFTGQTANGNYSAHWIASEPLYDKWYYSTGSAGGYFPKGQESQKLNYLPAAGCRTYTDGAPYNAGVYGYYWSSTAYLNTAGYNLYFLSTYVGPLDNLSFSYGFGARCVKDPVLEVDANGILVLKKASETRGKMMFFQFGSVVGFTQEGAWGEDKVLFNPTMTPNSTYAAYTSIPVYTAADWDANRKDISDPAYHNGANVKAGKGDPCKLVGLSAGQVQSMTAAQLDAYNSGWRLPTNAEQCDFTGHTGSVDYSAHWIASDSRYNKWYYSTGSAGCYFPKGQESQKLNYLPAAGCRGTDGWPSFAGANGYYWSSTVYSGTSAGAVFLGSTSLGLEYFRPFSHGFGVRCVKDVEEPVLEVDANGILVLKKPNETRGQMLFFQFGSVVGFTQEGDWTADKVLFKPSTPTYTSYTTIPVYTTADWDANRTNISDPAYHNGANVKAGKGDPCKLVGLSAKKIRSMSAAELDAYNSGWRLPTVSEQCDFTGQTTDVNYSAHWIASDSRYDKWYYSTGSAGGYFPQGQESQKKNYLPAAGCRNTYGSTSYVGSRGYYWSSAAYSTESGYHLYFNSSYVEPLDHFGYYYAHGFGARCVKDEDPVLEVDANGILVLRKASETRGKMMFFQFGSVVGFTQEGDWAAHRVLFNPVTNTPIYTSYTSIPVYTTADWNANRKDISDPAYHNGANVKAGKGDPCKLVGLSAKKIQLMTAAELNAYNSGWRLPTKEELCDFTGQTADVTYSAHWIASDSRYDKWYYSTGSAGGYFPKGQESQKLNYLPAAGTRLDSGSTSYVGSCSFYWSSTAYSGTYGYSLYFNSSHVEPLFFVSYANGFGARCVRR